MLITLVTCCGPSSVADETIIKDTAIPDIDLAEEAIPFLSTEESPVVNIPVQAVSQTSAADDQTIAVDDPDVLTRRLSDIRPSLDYAWGDTELSTLPRNFAVNTDDRPMSRVIGVPMLLQWQPSNLWYHPLYFEDPALERYGHTYSPLVQPFVSTGQFVGQAATLPYHATLRPHRSREYPLGWYRPGECAPHLKYHPAWNDEGAVKQAMAVVGLIFLIP